jgi:TonB family protein
MALDLPSLSWGTFPPEEGVVQMAFTWSKKMLAVAATALFAVSLAFAQQTIITGKVKIEVVIAPDGHVKSSRAMGGHPVLVQSCQDAVKEWRFEPAPEETTQVVEFDFRQ